MSVLATSPTSIRVFDINIANALGSSDAATILQQLHYWMQKKAVGVKVNGIKYVYNTFVSWVQEQFVYLTNWKFRKAMSLLRSLGIVRVIRHKAKQWNQTNYYSLDYQRLREWGSTQSIEISELCLSSPQGNEDRSLEMSDSKFSYIDPKNTAKKITAKQSDRLIFKTQDNVTAAFPETTLERKQPENNNPSNSKLSAAPERKDENLSSPPPGDRKDESSAQVEQIVNLKWKESISDLDGAGISVNKTLTSLLKMYPKEKVDNAIAIFKVRKRDRHVSNPSGYFVSVLKGDWGSKSLVNGENREVDTQAVFRHWYDLARELGYCSGQEVREGEQWVNLGGWERWSSAVGRGYSLDYLKKAIRRNKG